MKRFNLMSIFLLGFAPSACGGGTFESGNETANVAASSSAGTANGSGGTTSSNVSSSAISSTSTANSSSTSSSSSGFGGNCEPQSCLDQGLDCGVVDNGCGHKEDCGECTGSYQECGQAPPNPDGSNSIGKDNVCGGGCTDIGMGCPNDPMFVVDLFDCNVKGSAPPKANCEPVGSLPSAAWCCKVSGKP